MALFLIPFHEYLLNALGVSTVWFMDETPGRESHRTHHVLNPVWLEGKQ